VAHQRFTVPFHFEGFRPSTEPERSWQHLFRFYIAFQIGFGRAPHAAL
jgi:hypothetical protein